MSTDEIDTSPYTVLLDKHYIYRNNSISTDISNFTPEQLIEFIEENQIANLSPHYDHEHYLAQHDEILSPIEGIEHYCEQGWKEGYDPHYLFSTSYYLDTYYDIKEAGLNPLIHYHNHGYSERRNPHMLFNTDYYYKTYPDILNSKFIPSSHYFCLLYTSPSPRDATLSRMPSSA